MAATSCGSLSLQNMDNFEISPAPAGSLMTAAPLPLELSGFATPPQSAKVEGGPPEVLHCAALHSSVMYWTSL